MAGDVYDDTYRETVRALSDRLVEAQRPIRILDSIKWDESIEQGFFAAGAASRRLKGQRLEAVEHLDDVLPRVERGNADEIGRAHV